MNPLRNASLVSTAQLIPIKDATRHGRHAISTVRDYVEQFIPYERKSKMYKIL